MVPAFAEDHRVVLFDYVGAGRSDLGAYDADRYSSLDGYAQDVLDVCDALDLRDATFVGHSVSAMVGVLASVRAPERVGALIMVGPSPRYVNDGEYVGGFEPAEIERLVELLRAHAHLGGAELADAVAGAVIDYQDGATRDDIAVVTVEVRPDVS